MIPPVTEEDENGNNIDECSTLIAAYMKTYNSLHDTNGYGDTYEDSIGLNEIKGLKSFDDNIKVKRKLKEVDLKSIDIEKYEILQYDSDDLILKWGNYADEDLIFLENEYLDWEEKIGDYINEKSTELIIKEICKQTLEIKQKRECGEKVKDEVKTLQSLMDNGGVLEKQQKKTMEDKKIGMTIADIEKYRPLKETLPELMDVDAFGEILDTFLGGISRTMGKENSFTKRFDEIYKDYTIDLINNDNFEMNDGDSDG
jgi:hypothetical protein